MHIAQHPLLQAAGRGAQSNLCGRAQLRGLVHLGQGQPVVLLRPRGAPTQEQEGPRQSVSSYTP